MNFDTYTTEANRGKLYKIDNVEELPDYYTDPYLRRYFIIKFIAEASLLTIGVWGFKHIVENLAARKYKKVSPWL